MTNKTMLRRLNNLLRENHEMDEPALIKGILDDLATIGIDGASELYLEEIQKDIKAREK